MKKSFLTCLTFLILNSAENEMFPIIDSLPFIRVKNTTSGTLKARNFFISRYFSVHEQLIFHAQLS